MEQDIINFNNSKIYSDFNTKELRHEVLLDIDDIETFYNVTLDLSSRPSGENLIVTWLDFDEKTDSYKNIQIYPIYDMY